MIQGDSERSVKILNWRTMLKLYFCTRGEKKMKKKNGKEITKDIFDNSLSL